MYSILCIDDESDNLTVLTSVLKADYRVYVAKSGRDGLDIVQTVLPDIILLDVLMPDMSGFDVIKALKDNKETREIPVIFITGLNEPEDEEHGLTLGACDYIHKPFHEGIVKARVENHIEIIRQRNLLSELALLDNLTELPNRRKWQMESEVFWHKAIKKQQMVVVGVLDIDHFKAYNDHFGHAAGDKVLKLVAQKMRDTIKKLDGDLYRYGGEEFVFCALINDPDWASQQVQALNQAISEIKITHLQSVSKGYLTVSVGVVFRQPQDDDRFIDAFELADKLMYQSKYAGGVQVLFEMDERLVTSRG